MPFQSEKQRRYLHANHPEIAKRWERDYAGGGRIGFDKGGEGYVALDAKHLWEKMMLEDYQPTEEEKRLIQIYLSMMNKGGRAGFNSGSNGITLGSDKYNIKFEPTASGSWTDQDLGHGYNIDEKNLAYGVDTTANIGPVAVGIDFENLSNKYDVTKDGQTIEKDTRDDERLAFMLGITLEELHAKIRTNKDFKNFYLTITKQFHQGGMVPSHQAGIYGLAEGGQLVKPGPGRPGYAGMHDETAEAGQVGSGGGDHHGDVAHGEGGRFDVANQPPSDPSETAGDTSNYPNIHKGENINIPSENVGDKIKGWVTTETKKVPQFVANLKLAKKLNIPFLGASYITDKIIGKFKDKDKDKTSGLTDSIDFGLGLKDDTKVKSKLGDTDFSEIKGHTAMVTDKQKETIESRINMLNRGLIDVNTVYENTKVFDDTGSKGVFGIGVKEAEPMSVEEFNKELINQGYKGKEFITETAVGAEGGIAGLKHGGQLVKSGSGRPGYGGPQDWGQEERGTGSYGETGTGETGTGDTGTGSNFDYGKDQEEDVAEMMQNMGITPDHTPDYGRGWVGAETDYGAGDYSTEKDLAYDLDFRYGHKTKPKDQWTEDNKRNAWIEKKQLGKEMLDAFKFGIGPFSMAKFAWGQNKKKKAEIANLQKMIDSMKKKGMTEFNPHMDTPLQLAQQLMTDLTTPTKQPDQDHRGTGITYPAIARVNDKKEMELASAEWRTKQEEVDRSKQMAYWRMMMAPYMSAKGGRVPAGYNTGGLSNLFRLKNR